jgi:hypothetical protein
MCLCRPHILEGVDTQQVESDDLEGKQTCPEGQESRRGLEWMKNEEEGLIKINMYM